MDETLIDKYKKLKGKAAKLAMKVKNAVAFFSTPVGWVVGIIILILFGLVLLYLGIKILENQLGLWFVDDFAGISTTQDYDVIVASLSSSGYDSFISEEKWQEYAAFEYAILMDVAGYIHDNQDFFINAQNEDGSEYHDANDDAEEGKKKPVLTNAVFPEGIVHTEYNHDVLSVEHWREFAVEGQRGVEHDLRNEAEETKEPNGGDRKMLGGNRNVITPRLIYEVANNDYQEDSYSWMPYIMVVREDIELNYFLESETGMVIKKWKQPLKGGKGYGKNLEEIDFQAHGIEEAVKKDLEAVRTSAELNRFNYTMPSSAYIKDFEKMDIEAYKKLNTNSGDPEVISVQDAVGYVVADRYDIKEEDENGKEKPRRSYGNEVYYIEQPTHIVYKIPLRTLINRYLPKATLLTTWYMLKPDEEANFDINDLMKVIKEIYAGACYGGQGEAPKITITGGRDDYGQIVEIEKATMNIDKLPEDRQLRAKADELSGDTVSDAVIFKNDGKISRDPQSKEADLGDQAIQYGGTNYSTFVYFQQYGLENSRYEKYKIYLGTSGDYEPYSGDEARPSFETVSANYITRDRVNMIETINLLLHKIVIVHQDDTEETVDDLPVHLRTAYNIISGESGDTWNRIRLNELYPDNPKLDINQPTPYAFMLEVVANAEETALGGVSLDSNIPALNLLEEKRGGSAPEREVIKYSGDDEDENEKLLDHHFVNIYYMPATVGNYQKLLKEYKTDYKIVQHVEEIMYKLPEDFRYFNQNTQIPIEESGRFNERADAQRTIDKLIPHWYDFKELQDSPSMWEEYQTNLENAYLKEFFEIYKDDAREDEIKEFLKEELSKNGYDVKEVKSFAKEKCGYEKDVEYNSKYLAPVYVYGQMRNKLNERYGGGELEITGDAKDGTHNPNMKDVMEGDYRVNYYWTTVYNMKVKRLKLRQTIHHRRMPALFVRYVETWGKATEYKFGEDYGKIKMNPLNYRNFRYLIPDSINSLGLVECKLYEKSDYRTESYSDFFGKTSEDTTKSKVKEADVLDMLAHWEKYGDESNEVGYAYMRELYKLVIEIRDKGQLLESAYSYLYIPYTITNYKDGTLQKVFWLERLGVTQGEDELNETEQKLTRTKGLDVKWQNVKYEDYWECIEDIEGSSKERVKMYALFPFGSPYIRAYTMTEGLNGGGVMSQGFSGGGGGGEAGHNALDLCSRENLRSMYFRSDEQHEKIYYYELNRLTLKYIRAGNHPDDAFHLAEETLNRDLQNSFLYSPVVAVLPGIVTKVDYDARSGFQVNIVHPKASYNKAMQEYLNNNKEFNMEQYLEIVRDNAYASTFYCHLKRWPLVDVGDVVGAGTILGYEGTTGRSTGYHLHFEMKKVSSSGGTNIEYVNPEEYIVPMFRPFYYDEKASKIVEQETDLALGSEYYTLERTILPDFGLAQSYNVINGRTLKDGTVIDHTFDYAKHSGYYTSGDIYEDSAEYSGFYWGNDVGETVKPLVDDQNDFFDLNNLNRRIEYRKGDEDTPDGKTISFDGLQDEAYLNAPPESFDKDALPTEPDWYMINIAEYKSPRVVPHYNGPKEKGETITEEGRRDLKDIQISFRKAGFYNKAGIEFKQSGFGTFSDEFERVVKEVQKELSDKGYGSFKSGVLDDATISAYNSYITYLSSKKKTQDLVSTGVGYYAGLDLSTEAALIRGGIVVKSGNLTLKEEGNSSAGMENGKKLYYSGDKKTYYKEQGLFMISINKAIERFKEDNIKDYQAVLDVRQPLRNSKVGAEMIKEYEIYFYENYSGDLTRFKNGLLYGKGDKPGQWWIDLFEGVKDTGSLLKSEDSSKQVFYRDIQLMGNDQRAWMDADYFERMFLYALALEAYEEEDPEKVDVKKVIGDKPQYDFTTNTLNYFMVESGSKSSLGQ